MRIWLNGEAHEIDDEVTLHELLERLGYGDAVVAVAVDETFVPRSTHHQRTLRPDERVEVVAPMAGG